MGSEDEDRGLGVRVGSDGGGVRGHLIHTKYAHTCTCMHLKVLAESDVGEGLVRPIPQFLVECQLKELLQLVAQGAQRDCIHYELTRHLLVKVRVKGMG